MYGIVPGENIMESFIKSVGEKNAYGLFIFVICGMAVLLVVFLTYFAQKVNVDLRYASFYIFIVVFLPVFVYLKYRNYINVLLNLDSDNYGSFINLGVSLFYLIVIGITFGIFFGTSKDMLGDSNIFSKNTDYSAMNKYVISSVGIWFAMFLVILLCIRCKDDSIFSTIFGLVLIIVIIAGAFLKTTTEMNVYVVGDTVEVNDAGNDGWRWIRGKVREVVFNNFTQMTAVYVDNLEYGDQGDHNEGQKNSRYSYGLASVRIPKNRYKIGNRVEVNANNSWNKATINGFGYYSSGEISSVYVNGDTNSYSINPINVRQILATK